MPSKTLLDYTQDILSALDSDEVQSITDTVESLQVARVIKRSYDAIVMRADLNEHYTTFQVYASGDNNQPTIMYRPDDVDNIQWLKYNCETADDTNDNWRDVQFQPLDTFLKFQYQLKADADNVVSFDLVNTTWMTTGATDTITVLSRNDKAPQYYTCLDDYTLIFDSYDAEVDTTLQEDKSLAYGKKDQIFTMDDEFIPFVDQEFGTLLLNESMALAFAELKQVPHELATKWANRAWTKTGKAKRGVDNNRRPIDDQVNYGRK